MDQCTKVLNNFMRKKDFSSDLARNDLRKILGLSDLAFLAIGAMIGAGIYVTTGAVAHDIAGPSVVLSYVFAAVASIFSAVGYAEFASRTPITGSAYQYVYFCIGEIWAFIIGWNVLLEHAISASFVARGWSGYVDALFGNPIKHYLTIHFPLPGGLLSTYPDFLAAVLLLVLTILLAFGIKISSNVTLFFASLNLVVLGFIIVTGIYLSNGHNWDSGNFFPFGWSGTLSGTAILIVSYTGYEVIASATEESVNPKKDVPRALFIALSLTIVAYVGSAISLTLMVPWQEIKTDSPFSSAYVTRGWPWAKYLVSVGALAAITAALMSALLVVPRYMYAMARDGLLFSIFEKVNETTKVPVISTIVTGLFCMVCSLIFSIQTLLEFVSIGQLFACTFVSICVIKLRYEPNKLSSYNDLVEDGVPLTLSEQSDSTLQSSQSSLSKRLSQQGPAKSKTMVENSNTNENNEKSRLLSVERLQTVEHSCRSNNQNCGMIKDSVLQSKFNSLFKWTKTFSPGLIPFYSLLIAILTATVAIILLLFARKWLHSTWYIAVVSLLFLVSLLAVIFISAFDQDETIKTFKVPLVPFVPFVSILINIILILNLQPLTWIRFVIWLVLGLSIYFGYGYGHSTTEISED